ncbi:hypothetical protein NOK75_20975 [Vibrio parahaemolyticus]|jgi:hypothetical protein|uniref:hypothetical protein n=1 Tax=Vibrio TaxID=662 RepID=UPI00193E02E5|nr:MULTISPECIES: hypothetical protein [Vibrio]MBM5100791.1 hypothetical protein [Vibrio parahaemolyticus]MBM5105138.1 hypothetical protein [Vibrio parahaemolyticus]MCF7455275.1 hypothetical protein [Vibrio sp. A1-1]MCQ9071182.1 hypothetical protein [Vibrio alginolyticus]MCX8844350.1 hypothetical protein [Vibrio parahaemolyticus]
MASKLQRLASLEAATRSQNSRIDEILLIAPDMAPSEAAMLWRRVVDAEPPKYPKTTYKHPQDEAEQVYKSLMCTE